MTEYERIESLVIEVQKKYGIRPIVTEFYKKSNWCRINFGTNRHLFLEKQEEIKELILSFDLGFSIDIKWKWEIVDYEGISFNNPTKTYGFFASPGIPKKYDFQISDTHDPLYKISLFELRDYWNKFEDKNLVEFYSYRRTEYGFMINFQTRKNAEIFDKTDMFSRKRSWEKVDKEYVCHLYMKDKDDLCPGVILKSLFPKQASKPKEISKPKEDRSSIFELIKSGKMTLEEFENLK